MEDLKQRCGRPVVLCVLDGWGHRQAHTDNAIVPANSPVFHALKQVSPHALLEASGRDVGLPAGQMGNSEVGHLNLGAGRVVHQDIRRIDAAIEDGSLGEQPELRRFITSLRQSGGRSHLMGLMSPGGVHAHQKHIAALARILDRQGIPVIIHGFLDGRDAPPSSAAGYVADFLEDIADLRGTEFGTLCGRFFAMDRDQRWERVKRAHQLLLDGSGRKAHSPGEAIKSSYAAGKTDEFVEPVVIQGYSGMRDGDGLLMANFRADRAREITRSLLAPQFDGFDRHRRVRFAAALGMTEYSAWHNGFMGRIFSPQPLHGILGEVIADAGKSQLRIAETEKYAHVTFFFNGGVETLFQREERILVPSPRVATYDEQPEMSALELTDQLVSKITSGKYDFILVNYANTDMVGHTGLLAAAEAAVRTVDFCIGRVARAVQDCGGHLLITADHGNAETMFDVATGNPHTAHTTNPVPVLLANPPSGVKGLANGRLADVAPTILDLMDLTVPRDMSGETLLIRNRSAMNGLKERVAV